MLRFIVKDTIVFILKKYSFIILLIELSSIAYSQCANNQLTFVDSLGQEINSSENDFKLILNNGKDTIILDTLFDIGFTQNMYYGWMSSNEVELSDFPVKYDQTQNNNLTFCALCLRTAVQIVDSIDINQDGVKEIFLYRIWHCNAIPPNPGPVGEGVQQQTYGQYEVWDVTSKKKIFEVKNWMKSQIAVTTSVVRTEGYRFKVEIKKNGDIVLSNPRVKSSETEIYKYNSQSGNYEKQ